jgi:hypothetical protein
VTGTSETSTTWTKAPRSESTCESRQRELCKGYKGEGQEDGSNSGHQDHKEVKVD